MMDTLTDPQTWLVLVALIHAVVGVILPTDWSKDSSKLMGGFVLLTSVTMLYAAFGMDGEEQARLALVIAGPIWVWFVICCSMQPCLLYTSPSPRDLSTSRMPSSA